jgi:hypothetical protein
MIAGHYPARGFWRARPAIPKWQFLWRVPLAALFALCAMLCFAADEALRFFRTAIR